MASRIVKTNTVPCTVSELVLATANDEIPDVFQSKDYKKKIGGMK